MKYTETEAEKILEKLIASTRSPRGRFSAKESYRLLEKRLPHAKARLFGAGRVRILVVAAAVMLLCAMGWTVHYYMLPVSMQTVSTLAECRNLLLPDGTEVTLNHFTSLKIGRAHV